jgi:hypothetical protein
MYFHNEMVVEDAAENSTILATYHGRVLNKPFNMKLGCVYSLVV